TGTGSGTNARIELSVANWGIQGGFDDPNAGNDAIYKALCEKFNITINPIQITWDDWMDKARIWAASNQLPDLFTTDASMAEYTTWATQGVIKALPDDLSRWPTILATMSQASVKPLAVNGRYYKYPRMAKASADDWVLDRTLVYRKDWLEQAGYTQPPQNFEEFVTAAKKVLSQHPEAVGLTVNTPAYLLYLMAGIYPEGIAVKNWAKEDGVWKPVYATRGFAQGVAQFRRLYAEGILDRDFVIQQTSSQANKYSTGQAFAFLGGGGIGVSDYYDARETQDVMDIWPAPDGNKYYLGETPYWAETMFSARISNEKFERALDLIDYMSTEDWLIQRYNGILNVDYRIENGTYISLLPTDQTLAKKYPVTNVIYQLGAYGEWLPYAGKTVIPTDPQAAWARQKNVEYYTHRKATARPMPVNYDIYLMTTPNKDKVAGEVMNDLIRVIAGTGDPVAAWQQIIRDYEAQGLTDAINEVNAKAKELGIQ
ncbi:MAG: extracellular solute-binding protein, partial [Treponema sp.]|nr:extracellular solute-binding protein [Treponema sp.]